MITLAPIANNSVEFSNKCGVVYTDDKTITNMHFFWDSVAGKYTGQYARPLTDANRAEVTADVSVMRGYTRVCVHQSHLVIVCRRRCS
jgi:hypothetical protein